MLCPDCRFDNIEGSDACEACGASLAALYPRGNEVEQSIAAHAIQVLCPRPPVFVSPTTPVREVMAQMAERGIGCVLVLDGSALVGVFSERDVLNKVSADWMRLDQPVAAFMTRNPATLTRNDSIGYALQGMDLGGYRHIPVLDAAGYPDGIISVRDIMRFLCVKYARSRT